MGCSSFKENLSKITDYMLKYFRFIFLVCSHERKPTIWLFNIHIQKNIKPFLICERKSLSIQSWCSSVYTLVYMSHDKFLSLVSNVVCFFLPATMFPRCTPRNPDYCDVWCCYLPTLWKNREKNRLRWTTWHPQAWKSHDNLTLTSWHLILQSIVSGVEKGLLPGIIAIREGGLHYIFLLKWLEGKKYI